MATILSHPAVPVAIAMVLGKNRIPKPLLQMGIIASIWPDFDCWAFVLGIPYESQFGHRGFMHSIVFALLTAAFCAWRLPKEFDAKPSEIFSFIFVSTASHPLLDMLTDGGLGVAIFWPFSTERFFFPVHPLPVSPIGRSFISARGLFVFLNELVMVWTPCLLAGGTAWIARRVLEKKKPG